MLNWQRFVEVNHYQSSARPLILFKTKTKTCLDFKFLSRPIPRHVLKLKFVWDQYQYLSWFGIFVKTYTKTSLDTWNNSRPIPRLLRLETFETNTNTNTGKFNPNWTIVQSKSLNDVLLPHLGLAWFFSLKSSNLTSWTAWFSTLLPPTHPSTQPTTVYRLFRPNLALPKGELEVDPAMLSQTC